MRGFAGLAQHKLNSLIINMQNNSHTTAVSNAAATQQLQSTGSTAAFFRAAEQNRRLSAAEARALCHAHAEAILAGDAATANELGLRLICSHLYVVAQVVRDYKYGVDVPELISAGCEGLMHALKTFDASIGCPFAAHAKPWVRQAVARAHYRFRIGAAPVTYRMAEAARKLYNATKELSLYLHREPTTEELAARCNMAEKEVLETQNVCRLCYSLQQPLSEDSDSTYGDSLVDPAAGAVYDSLDHRLTVAAVLHNVQCFLRKNQQYIVLRRLGLGGDSEEASFAAIAKELKLSATRVKQLYAEACATLRALPALQQMHADLCA